MKDMSSAAVREIRWEDGIDDDNLGSLLTAPGGLIPISEEMRLKLAIFSSGVVFIQKGLRWDPSVRSAVGMASSKVSKFHYREVDTTRIVSIYGDKSNVKMEAPDIDRQRELAEIIQRASDAGASDIHLRVLKDYTEVRIRVHGRLKDLSTHKAADGMPMIKAIFAVASDLDGASSEISFQQGALTWRSKILPPRLDMIRLQYTPESEGRGSIIMRLKPKAKATEIDIDTLGYNALQMENIGVMRKRTNGLYILAGKVSSGKTTTLQRVLNKMIVEKNREISMYTIEEPKELELPNAIQHPAKKLPDGTDGFIEAMKAALRSDLNVIVVGEIRSKMLADLAIQAVMTGHALWSTIHAGSALGILDRLSDFGVEPWKLQDPSVVRGLTYQRLCGVICPHCRISFRKAIETGRMEEGYGLQLSEIFGRSLDDLHVRGDGCSKCGGMGLIGRTVVAETCLTDPNLLNLFKDGKRMEMRRYWTETEEHGGMGGIPVMHHALSKVGAGLCNIFEIEEEVDLLSSYMRDYPHLVPLLPTEVRNLERKLGK